MFEPKTSYNPGIEKDFHATFFGKVMMFFGLAVLASAAGTYTAMTYFMEYFTAMPWLMFAAFAVELIIIFTSRMWSQKAPLNRFLFAAFAFITGVTIAPLIGIVAATPAGMMIVTKALVATALVFTATATIGWTTKKDLSGMRGFLTAALIGMIVVSIFGIFMPWGSTFELGFSALGVMVFSGYIIYDFQQLKHYPEDRYIDAALNLYLDIFNLFIYILRLILAFQNRD